MSTKSPPKSWFILAAVAACLGASASAFSQTAQESLAPLTAGQAEIPSQLINEPDDVDPNGPCSQCAVRTIKQAEESESPALVEIYYDDEQPSFCGSIGLEVLLLDDTIEFVLVEDVVLQAGEVSTFGLEEQETWSWNEAVEVRVEPVSEC